MRTKTLILCLTLGLFLAMAGQAAAKTIKPYAFSTSFNGAGSTAGTFAQPVYVAIDHATGNVYVMDAGNGGVLDQFTENGTPLPFTDPSRGGATSISVGSWLSTFGNLGAAVSIDNSGTATQGRIFALKVAYSPDQPRIYGFTPSGAVINENWPVCGFTCGKPENWPYLPTAVAIDSEGTPWVPNYPFVGTPPEALNAIDVETGSRKDQIILGQLYDNIYGSVCCTPETTSNRPGQLAFDADDNFYVVASHLVGCVCQPALMKYSKDGTLLNGAVSTHILKTPGSEPNDTGVAVDKSNGTVFTAFGDHVEIFDPSGKRVDSIGGGGALDKATGVAVNPTTHDLYVTNRKTNTVDIYKQGAPVVVPDVSTGGVKNITLTTATVEGVVNPDNGGDTTECFFQLGSGEPRMTKTVPCTPAPLTSAGGPQTVTANVTDLDCSFFIEGFGCLQSGAVGVQWYYRLVTKNAAGPQQTGEIKRFRNGSKPALGVPTATALNTDGATIEVKVDPQGADTEYTLEYGETEGYGSSIDHPAPKVFYNGKPPVEDAGIHVEGLKPDTTYHYKVVAENIVGTTETTDRIFRTFPKPVFDESCPNSLSRQQTGAANLLNCRSYEIVSAADQGGYDVESDLAPGQTPYPGHPDADGRLLYAVHDGGIPNSGNPTNRGPDPYVATRGSDGWTTSYVGIPADNSTPSLKPFSSTLAGADSSLSIFAFGGPDICDPCFANGSAGLPLRGADGTLGQGMAGSEPVADPTPAGTIEKPLSADGTHFVFGSEQKFTADGNSGEVAIYVRNLATGATSVVSKKPTGGTMTGAGIADTQLDISADGSRVLLGDPMGTDAKGNSYFHLYMNVDAAGATFDLTPGTVAGVRYDGMSADGTAVYFTTKDAYGADTDTSADLYRADVPQAVAPIAPVRVSTGSEPGVGDTDSCTPASNWNTPSGGPNCDVVAIGGGGGVASEDGSAFFLSPEKLDGAANGVAGQPNLYVAEQGQAPRFVLTLETSNPAVTNGIADAGSRHTADFQVAGNGDTAVFPTTLSLTPGFENRSFSQIYRYDVGGDELLCASCSPTNAPATSSASLASNGLSVTEDGRVFFSSQDQLVLRDSNSKQDAYEWDEGVIELVSSGSDSNHSSFMSVSSDGRDAFFYTREVRVPQDKNGPVVKVYDARESGGFFYTAPKQPCKASDECHGAGTVAQPHPQAPSRLGTPGNVTEEPRKVKKCRKGFVKKKGKCVRKRKSSKNKKGGRR